MMPTQDLDKLRLVFTDNFTNYGDVQLGTFPEATGGRWSGYRPSTPDTTGFGWYDMPKTISVKNGVLDIWVHTKAGVHYVAAPWPVLAQGCNLAYGRIEFAFRSQRIDGYKTAWLLWPDSDKGVRDGEIDFPEGNLDGADVISGYVHRQDATVSGDQEARPSGAVYANDIWHRGAIVWLPNLCEFWLDGVKVGATITARVPNTPMHWIFQTETKLDFATPPPDSSQGHVQLDWVAVWKYDPFAHALSARVWGPR